MVNYALKHLYVRPTNIILAGESSGGTLAAALCTRILEEEVRPPKGLLLAAPALYLDQSFSPGLLSKDPLLPFHLLEASRQLYLNGAYGESWVVSPGNYSDLQEFPKVRLLVGDKDPLFYDSLRFAKALQNKGGDVKVTVYEGGLHCLLSLSQAVAEYETVVADSVEYLQELR